MPRLGLVTDPDFPDQVARSLSEKLPARLREQLEDEREWSIEVVTDPIAAGRSSGEQILEAVGDQQRIYEWDYAVGMTDLPLRAAGRPVLADVGTDGEVAVISIPALGGIQPYRRTTQMVVQVVDDMTRADETSAQPEERPRRELQSAPTELFAPIRQEHPSDLDEIGIRYRATRRRGMLRLLTGMVRSNAPWRLILGMTSAFAASVATSVFGLSSSTVWQIGDVLGPWRRAIVVIGVIAAMSFWLIMAHNLWEKRAHSHDREQRALYNGSTALTVTTGVTCLYVVLFVVNLGGSLFLIDPSLLESTLGHSVGLPQYLALAWAATSMGVAAGALGSGLEDDATVRQAAYGYRESQRRASQHKAEESAQGNT